MDVWLDKLVEILITGNDHRLQTLFGRLSSERSNNIIGLVAVQLHNGIVESFHNLSDATKALP